MRGWPKAIGAALIVLVVATGCREATSDANDVALVNSERERRNASASAKKTSPGKTNASSKLAGAYEPARLERNRKAAEEYLERNASRATVKRVGRLQIEIVTQGGAQVVRSRDEVVTLTYTAYRADGSPVVGMVRQSVTTEVSSLMPAWRIALESIGAGGRVRLAAPSELAFGARGIPGRIAPGEAHILDLTLVRIDPGHAGGANEAPSLE